MQRSCSSCLRLFAAVHAMTLVAKHLPGKENDAADAISHGNLPVFFYQVPQAAIPKELLDILVLNQPEWTSAFW